jgi:hypothetical protein
MKEWDSLKAGKKSRKQFMVTRSIQTVNYEEADKAAHK